MLLEPVHKSITSVIPILQPFILLERLYQSSWKLVSMSCHMKPSQRRAPSEAVRIPEPIVMKLGVYVSCSDGIQVHHKSCPLAIPRLQRLTVLSMPSEAV
jgi:hypothetical protein